MLDAFDKGELDRIYLVSNGFVNAMTQQPKVEQLVPLAPAKQAMISTVLMVGTISTNQKQKNC
jgi:F0F1-type ATP synthase gamma subunit